MAPTSDAKRAPAGLGRPLAGARVHFVGIGGVGMAALAELLVQAGYEVSGSDLKESPPVARLRELGVVVHVGAHRAGNVGDADHVVVSNAVPAGNPEVAEARQRGCDVLLRAELLAKIFDAGRGFAVSGTHGKTTTSSLLAVALDAAGFSPSFLIGGDLNDAGSGGRLGASDIVVAEADEAFGSFLHLRPELAVVTNVDLDHLDYYSGQDAIDEAFVAFLDARRPGGTAVLCADDPGVRRIIGRVRPPVVTYGTTSEDLRLERAGERWRAFWRRAEAGSFRLAIPGRHNALNASGALAAVLAAGGAAAAAIRGLEGFGGVERRFSVRGTVGGVTVVDDYAHNPAKVAATLCAARDAYPSARIVAVFQPHLYSRTRTQGAAFGPSFADADVVVVTDVYGQREEPEPGVSGRIVYQAVRDASPGSKEVLYIPRLEQLPAFVAGLLRPGDVVLTLGAGDITTAAGRLLESLEDGTGRRGGAGQAGAQGASS